MERLIEMFSSYYFYILVILAITIVNAIIQARLRSTYKKWGGIENSRQMTGAEAARAILERNGILDVQVERIAGELTDNYNPKTHVLSLSAAVYDGRSVASVGIAAHEAGHAIQHGKNYIPVKLRTILFPVANIGARFSWLLIIVGLLISAFSAVGNLGFYLAVAGVAFYAFAVLFSIVTLPVELNASRRASNILSTELAMDETDIRGVKKVLKAAAYTYVVSTIASIVNLLRMVAIVSSGNRRR